MLARELGEVDEMMYLLHYAALTLLLQISLPPTIDREVVNTIWKTDSALMDVWQSHSNFVREFNSEFRDAPTAIIQHKQVILYWFGVEEAYTAWRRQTIRDGQMSGRVLSLDAVRWKRMLLLRLGSFMREVGEVELPYRSKRWNRFKKEVKEFRKLMEGV